MILKKVYCPTVPSGRKGNQRRSFHGDSGPGLSGVLPRYGTARGSAVAIKERLEETGGQYGALIQEKEEDKKKALGLTRKAEGGWMEPWNP